MDKIDPKIFVSRPRLSLQFFGEETHSQKNWVSFLGAFFFGIGPWLSTSKETHLRQLKRPNDGSEIKPFRAMVVGLSSLCFEN